MPAAVDPSVARLLEEASRHGIDRLVPGDDDPPTYVVRPADQVSEYPRASRLAPAAPSNYTAWTAATPRRIERIVIHITDGHAEIGGTIRMFQTDGKNASAHYIVGQDGEVVQLVRHKDIAWHAHAANGTSIGIEHAARSPGEWDKHLPPGHHDPGLPVTKAQYRASARLVAWLAGRYRVPIDSTHILGHRKADPQTTHTDCPDRIWNWTLYLRLVRAAAGSK